MPAIRILLSNYPLLRLFRGADKNCKREARESMELRAFRGLRVVVALTSGRLSLINGRSGRCYSVRPSAYRRDLRCSACQPAVYLAEDSLCAAAYARNEPDRNQSNQC